MSVDAYGPCPCGSGKKFKFCCSAIADDMDRIARLIEGNQPRVAVQQLEVLDRKHPDNAWIGYTRGMILLDQNEPQEARDQLRHVLEVHPDNELAIALYAIAVLRSDGPDAAKKPIHRAFQKSAKKLPSMVSDLAAAMASIHLDARHLMAAREHLALALRLAPEERRQMLFVQLLELDGADDVPFPMRGSHPLPVVTGTDELLKEVRKAQKYAAVGCWSTAADVFSSLANAQPNTAELWHAAGLCRAWDGDETVAADALHRAAQLYSDEGIAVECETLAQLLDEKTTQDVAEERVYSAEIESVSRLLSMLDNQPRIHRLVVPPGHESEDDSVASYVVLDRKPDGTNGATWTKVDVPVVLAKIVIYDANPEQDQKPLLLIAGRKGGTLEEAKTILSNASGDQIKWVVSAAEPKLVGTNPTEWEILEHYWWIPPKMTVRHRRDLLNTFWDSAVNEKWMDQSARSLGGKTPRQAATDPSLRVRLLAAINVLDANLQRRQRGYSLAGIHERLNIAPLPLLEVTPETAVGGLSILQLHRLPVDRLTDSQLVTAVNRSMLVRHDDRMYEVLKAAVDRPSCTDQLDVPRIYRLLSENSWMAGRRDEAIEWIDRGRKIPTADGKAAFQNAWSWDMAELGILLEDPSDPKLKALLQRFVNYYGPKVPQIRPHIEQTLAAYDIPSPWDSLELGIVTPSGVAGGIWTPGSTETTTSSGKLWVPGQ